MFKVKICITYLIGIMLLGLTACNLPLNVQGPLPPPDDLASTAAVQTAVANYVIATLAALQGSPGVVETTPPPPLPAFTETPTLTPSPTLSPTSEKTTISVSMDTNCRAGPGKVYDYLGGLLVGETSEVFARDPSGNYWYIRNPDKPSGFCWVTGQYATILGPVSGLPIYTPEPTPTPSVNFNISYLSLDSCVGWYAKFKIKNTGGVTLESAQVKVKDNTTNTVVNYSSNTFDDSNGCLVASSVDELLPGEAAIFASNPFAYNPTGNSLTLTITACTEEALAGTCFTRTLNFTP